jgi:hypothetical protein
MLGSKNVKNSAQVKKDHHSRNNSPYELDSNFYSPLKPAARPIPEKLRKKIAKYLKKVNFDEILKKANDKREVSQGQKSLQSLPQEEIGGFHRTFTSAFNQHGADSSNIENKTAEISNPIP